MRKMIILLAAAAFLLTGCFNPASVSVVEDMYEEALLEDEAAVAAYFNKEFLREYPIEELADELATQVRNVEGIKLLNAIELTGKRLNPEIAAELDDTYEERWHYIVNDAGEGDIMTWIVLKTSTHYEITDGKKVTADYYNKHIKNE
ncbi:hypothetical protein [Oceanobacillus alkalisoli]|uniref:hypothetical protein n=1 Tax=Oceanobacillus alkalisoli TaxID=2925113 RepID=UPI001EE45AE9|nr:hypothetical protein [Oceanobacillus alkalisoli]MCG5102134.1 hypothetical protein [Oceanobacillus alkalisoli]